MSHESHPLPLAGDYLVATFADMMHSARFRKHVWSRMQLAERRRLESLRLQALYGDAPHNNAKVPGVSATEKNAKEHSTVVAAADVVVSNGSSVQSSNKGRNAPLTSSASSTSQSQSPQPAPSPPRWFDIAGRARYSAWVALRGYMSPDVAAECFCAEFLGVIKKYPHPALLPPVEAALSTAHGLAQRARSHGAPTRHSGVHSAAASLAAATAPVFQVRALQGDPAALALLWICRAYRIPCEFVIEPLSKALSRPHAAPITATAATKTSDAYLPYTMADACYPFSASLLYPTGAAGLTVAGSAYATTSVTTPEAAFVLFADTFLSAYPHWMGVPADTPPSSASSSSTHALLQRCSWIDELQHITRHVRTPILALLVHQATQSPPSCAVQTPAVAAGRRDLLRAVAAHLHRYESWTMERVVNRRVGQALSVLSPLLASTAVVDALKHAYAPDAKAVTAADVFVASCGYVLCTHPFCADVFPLLRVPAGPVEGEVRVREQWPSRETAAPPTPASSAKTKASAPDRPSSYMPWALPLYLSGLSADYNEKLNRLLRREADSATQHEQQNQPVRLLLNDSNCAAAMDAASPSKQQHQKQKNARYYEVSAASATKEAAEAVGQLILARLHSLRSDDLQHDGVVRSTSSVSGLPFLVLGEVFALTWALTQEQVPAFPYFMLDGNPDHHNGFSFLSEEEADAGKRLSKANCGGKSGGVASPRARPRFQVSLAPVASSTTAGPIPAMLPATIPESSGAASASSQDGGASIESRLRSGLHSAGTTLLKGVRRLSGLSKDEDAQAGRTSGVHASHVLRSEGSLCGSGGSEASPTTEMGSTHR